MSRANRCRKGSFGCKRNHLHKGSFTIEASIYVPMVLFLMMYVITCSIHFFQESKTQEIDARIEKMDIVQEFYTYKAIGEIWEELRDD